MASVTDNSDGPRFRLGELSDMAGVAKKTIHYYLNIGILPPPERVHERLSLYSENHFKLIKLVQKLQHERKLPLAFITQLFKQGDYDADALELGFIADVYGKTVKGESLLSEEDRKKAAKKPDTSSVSRSARSELVKLGVISKENASLAPDEIKLARTLEQAKELGVPFEMLGRFQELIAEMVKLESKTFINSIQDDSSYEAVVNHLAAIDNLINTFIRRSKSHQIRKHYEKSIADAPLSMEKLQESLYIPSEAFLKKHNISREISKMAKQERQKYSAPINIKLAESYLAIGEYKKALKHAEKVMKKSKKNADALVLAAAAHALLSQTDEAVELAEKAVTLDPKNPRAAAYCAMTFILQGTRVGGIISPAKWLKKALDYFNKSITLKPRDERDRIDILLMKGRAFSIMPPSLAMVDEGIDALHELEDIIASKSDIEIGWPFEGFNEILYNNVHFYLGEAYSLKEDAEKMKYHWEKVVLSDPASNFGSMAYERLN